MFITEYAGFLGGRLKAAHELFEARGKFSEITRRGTNQFLY